MSDKFIDFLSTTNGIITLIIFAVLILISGSEIGKDEAGHFYIKGRKRKNKNPQNTGTPESLFFNIRQSEKELESKKVSIIDKYEKIIEHSKTTLVANIINLLLCDFPEIIKGKAKSVDRERDLLELYLDRDITEIFSRKLKELYDSPELNETTTLAIDQFTEKTFNEIKVELKVKAQKYLLMETTGFIDDLYKACERNILEFLNETIKTYISISKNKQKEINDALDEHKENLKYKILACEKKEEPNDK